MRKKLIYLPLGLLLVAGSLSAQPKPYTLTGTIKGKTDGYVYLSYAENEAKRIYKKDSALIKNGRFSFTGELPGVTQASVYLDPQSRTPDQFLRLFLVPGTMQLSLDAAHLRE